MTAVVTTATRTLDIVPVARASSTWRWVRPRPADGGHCDPWPILDDIARRVGSGERVARYSLPTSDLAPHDRCVVERLFPRLERLRLQPWRLAVELDAELFETPTASDAERPARFVSQASAIGAAVVIIDCHGGDELWRRLPTAHVDYVQPSRHLLVGAATNGTVNNDLTSLTRSAEAANVEMIAPDPLPEMTDQELLALGFSYRERPAD